MAKGYVTNLPLGMCAQCIKNPSKSLISQNWERSEGSRRPAERSVFDFFFVCLIYPEDAI